MRVTAIIKKRKCSKCHKLGHNIRSCGKPKLKRKPTPKRNNYPPCDLCGKTIHKSSNCPILKQTIKEDKEIEKRKQQMIYESIKNDSNDVQNTIECPICWDSVGGNDVLATTCGHVFCKNCLLQALSVKRECPICTTKQ